MSLCNTVAMKEAYFVDLLRDGAIEYRSDGGIWRTVSRYGAVLESPVRIDRMHKRGYRVLSGAGDSKAMAHRVIWVFFNGPIPAGLEINHKNGDKADNRLENLEAITHRENIIHAYKELGRKMGGPPKSGRANHNWRLPDHPTWDEVVEIRASTETSPILAKRYGIAPSTVRLIKLGKRRKLR